MEQELKDLLERGVNALERLGEDPVVQVETKPPVCPHCGRINPTVRTSESEGTGALAETVYRFHCLHCNQVFYGIPMQWECVKSTTDAQSVISMKMELGGFNDNKR